MYVLDGGIPKDLFCSLKSHVILVLTVYHRLLCLQFGLYDGLQLTTEYIYI